MGAERFNRQLDLVNVKELDIPIHVVGVGGIGSWTTLLLAKMGCPDIHVYDMDEVEDHNVASQFYASEDLGKLKVQAIIENVGWMSDIEPVAHEATEKSILKGIVIMAVDSMQARWDIYEAIKDKDVYIIDGRMGGLQLELHHGKPEEYVKSLRDPNGVDHDPCTARAISFNCAVIGGLIANTVRRYVAGELKAETFIMEFNNLNVLKHDL